MAALFARILEPFQEFFQTLGILRAPLVLGIVALLVLSTPDQVLELYLILARDWQSLPVQLSLTAASLALLSLLLAYVSRALTRTDEEVNVKRGERSAQGSFARTMPLVVGLLPLVGCAIGLYRALTSASTEVLRRTSETIAAFKVEGKVQEAFKVWQASEPGRERFTDAIAKRVGKLLEEAVPDALLQLPAKTNELTIAIYVGIAGCIATALLLSILYAPQGASSDQAPKRTRVFHFLTPYLVFALFAGTIGVFAAQHLNVGRHFDFDFTSIPRTLGTLTLVNLSLLFLLFLCSILTRWSDQRKIPVLSTLIVFAVVVSFFNWNDNHDVRILKSTPEEVATRKLGASAKVPPELADAFDAWFAKRPAEYKKKFEGKAYPIYIAAAQGGGMYAANLGGLTLARIYDRCPAIRHHLFAVSGVSGGSVGAGFLAAVLNDAATAPTSEACALEAPPGGKGPIETKMEKLLQKDFLSPVAASLLFPDLLQRLIPYPIDAFDRARAFEAGLEQAWDIVMKSPNPLRRPFWQHWRPDGASPMLFLNATIVETGHQVAISPVEIDPKEVKTLALQSMHELFELGGEVDVPLSTAMSLSARFPLVMPAGRLKLKNRDVRLVDGGYFENSGTEAGVSLIERLRDALCEKRGVIDYSNCEGKRGGASKLYAFKLLVLTDYDAMADVLNDPSTFGSGLNEIFSPVRTMYNSRVARGELIVGRMTNFNPDSLAPPNMVPTVIVFLNPQLYLLPLGWQLSSQVQSIISAQIGDPAHCGYGPASPAYARAWNIAGKIDLGLQMMGEESGRRKQEIRKGRMTPFMNMLYTLKSNQCSIFTVLGSDGVAPRLGYCKGLVRVEGSFPTRPSVNDLRQKWELEAEQQYGKPWAQLRFADGVTHSCAPIEGSSFRCSLEAAPCDPEYYQLVEGASRRR